MTKKTKELIKECLECFQESSNKGWVFVQTPAYLHSKLNELDALDEKPESSEFITAIRNWLEILGDSISPAIIKVRILEVCDIVECRDKRIKKLEEALLALRPFIIDEFYDNDVSKATLSCCTPGFINAARLMEDVIEEGDSCCFEVGKRTINNRPKKWRRNEHIR